ncbi:MAG: damage-inducible protein CinA, partial [Candidatus Neomarinimicrobiota bacterium]
MKAAIIAIGNELLNGISSDTNSVFIREKLIGIGIPTESIQVVGDKKGSIINALDSVAADIDVVLCTGGLGPTHDDITMRVTADYFDSQIGPSTEVREQIETLFRKRGVPVNRISVRNQSLVPEKAVLIPNLNGTAPGLKFSKYGKRYYFMPGVPVEMKNMFMQSILPELRKGSNRNIYIRTVHTTGVPESVLFGNIEQWISRHSDIRVSILPRFPEVDISLLCHNGDKSILNDAIRELSQILKDNIYGFDDDTLESVIAERLINHKITVATAESCTGG